MGMSTALRWSMPATYCPQLPLFKRSKAAFDDSTRRRVLQERGEAWDSKLEQQLCYEIKTFLLAGHETSAAMLTWTLYELTQHPDALAKVNVCGELCTCTEPLAVHAHVQGENGVCARGCDLAFEPMVQVKDEAVKAFGQDERHLSRDAVEEMTFTVSALKVCLPSVIPNPAAASIRRQNVESHVAYSPDLGSVHGWGD